MFPGENDLVSCHNPDRKKDANSQFASEQAD